MMKINFFQTKSIVIFLVLFLSLMLQSSMLHAKQGNRLKERKKNEVTKRDALYWYDKGSICATYGNDRAAIRHFKKAIKQDPQNAIFYFSLGVSYGEMGEYAKAIMYIDKALEFNPMKGLYYYGRGRVWLLSGKKSKAMKDFLQAKNLGSIDARKYLSYIEQNHK